MRGERAQSHVVGVVLLLGLTAVSMGALAAGAGVVLDSSADSADAARAADALAGIDPTAERQRVTVDLVDARLHTVERQLRVGTGERWMGIVDVNALAYDGSGDAGARFLAGAVQRGDRGFERGPAVGTAVDGEHISMSVAALDGEVDREARSGEVQFMLTATHERRSYRADTVAVETAHTGPWELAFERAGASVSVRDIDRDGVPSVVATFGAAERLSLSVHRHRIATA